MIMDRTHSKFYAAFTFVAFFTLAPLFPSVASANMKCLRSIKTPVLFTDAVQFKKTRPAVYNKVVSTFVESGFFIGPSILGIFEKQLIETGALSYNLGENSFMNTKEQAKANKEKLNFLANADKTELTTLGNELYNAVVESLALKVPSTSPHLIHEILEQSSLISRPWDQREVSFEEIRLNHEILSQAIATPEGERFVREILIESIPVYAQMLKKLLIYTNGSVDLASLVSGKLLWSTVLTTASGFIDIWSLSQVAAATMGALIDTPTVTEARTYLSNKKVKYLQREIGWSLAAKLRYVSND